MAILRYHTNSYGAVVLNETEGVLAITGEIAPAVGTFSFLGGVVEAGFGTTKSPSKGLLFFLGVPPDAVEPQAGLLSFVGGVPADVHIGRTFPATGQVRINAGAPFGGQVKNEFPGSGVMRILSGAPSVSPDSDAIPVSGARFLFLGGAPSITYELLRGPDQGKLLLFGQSPSESSLTRTLWLEVSAAPATTWTVL